MNSMKGTCYLLRIPYFRPGIENFWLWTTEEPQNSIVWPFLLAAHSLTVSIVWPVAEEFPYPLHRKRKSWYFKGVLC